jgi:hypothetical protein
MNNHSELDLMLKYIHESIKHDCEHHIMMNRVSLGLPPTDETIRTDTQFIDFKASIIDEKNIKGFKSGSIFDWTKNFIFPTVRHEKSWFWLKMLMMERYYAEQKRLLLTDISNHNKPDLESVIHWHDSLIGACLKIMFEHDFDIVWLDPIFGIYLLDLDNINFDTYLSIKRKAQRNIGVDYLYNIKISHRLDPLVGSFDYRRLNDDELTYLKRVMRTSWIPEEMIKTPNFNQTPVKNMWLERKTKRGK